MTLCSCATSLWMNSERTSQFSSLRAASPSYVTKRVWGHACCTLGVNLWRDLFEP